MNREKLLARLKEITAEFDKEGADVDALETEMDQIEGELRKLDLRERNLGLIQSGKSGNPLGSTDDETEDGVSGSEERGRALIDKRSVTLPSAVLAQHASSTINTTFNEISSVVDLVDTVTVKGGETYEQPYIKGYGTGDYTDEGKDAVEAEPVFGYSKIVKTKITAYAEISKEMQKLPAADYDFHVSGGIRKAINKKIAREIFLGNGTDGHYTGLFHNSTHIDKEKDIKISGIDENTLDDIIFSYGGDENVENGAECVLFLNKRDLKAFAKLRKGDKKVHDIKISGNTGTIDTVPFVLSSACSALTDSKTADGTYCMAYGYAKNYKQVVFSDIEIEESSDYKFRQGMICYRGEVYTGGNVVAHNGFLRIVKGSGQSTVLNVSSEAGSSAGMTKITVDDTLTADMKYKYKTGASLTDPAFDTALTSGWTNWDGTSEISATAGQNIIVAKVDGDNKCKAFGKTVIVTA